MEKQFKIANQDLREIIKDGGACIATDEITVEGKPVGYMVRETPINDIDTGWRFFSGDESEDYMNDPANLEFYNLNTIANYDPSIVPYLDKPQGTELAKGNKGNFVPVQDEDEEESEDE